MDVRLKSSESVAEGIPGSKTHFDHLIALYLASRYCNLATTNWAFNQAVLFAQLYLPSVIFLCL